LLTAALALGTATPASRGRAEEPAVRVSQIDAEYRNTPKGLFSCAACTFFIRPRSCKVVAGDISPTGWCKLFDLPD
jgi:hypothetical protein